VFKLDYMDVAVTLFFTKHPAAWQGAICHSVTGVLEQKLGDFTR